MGSVINGILSAFGAKHSDVEITAECNPSSFDERAANGLMEALVNRISLGIQSLDDDQLRFLGRRHDRRGGLRALELALNSGFSKVSCDLLFGLPQQTTETEVAHARILAAYPLSHLSVYALTIEENTPFYRLKQRGKLPIAVDERVAEAFMALHETLKHEGFEHYEISNYARTGAASLHNRQYWWGLPYLGLGVAAWGTLHEKGQWFRYRNSAHVGKYLTTDFTDVSRALYEALPSGFAEQVEILDAPMRLRERILLGLRLREGLDLIALEKELQIPVLTETRTRAIARQVARGNLVFDGSRISIEPEAWLRADSTIVELA
jgi:oxygen-independent coproporphyrinogen-3 oxidase